MKELAKRVVAKLLVFAMIVTVAFPLQAYATEVPMEDTEVSKDTESADAVGEGEILEFDQSARYAIIAQNGKAANTEKVGDYTKAVKFNGVYDAKNNVLAEETSLFQIIPVADQSGLAEGEVKVTIKCSFFGNGDWQLRTEDRQDHAWADGREDQATYVIKKTGDNTGIIREGRGKNRYATVSNNEWKFLDDITNAEDAAEFTFVENPKVPETIYSIENVATGKFIKTYDEENKSLTVDGNAGDNDVLFSKAYFVENTNNNAGVTYQTVGLISKAYGRGLKTVNNQGGNAEVSTVRMADLGQRGGWESIRIIPNHDGTVSLKDVYYDDYITVKDGVLQCGEKKTEDTLTDNEKFIVHTTVAPEDVTDLEINTSNSKQSSLELSWTNPSSIYSNMELQRKDPGEITYKKVANISKHPGEKVVYTDTGLQAGKEYSYKLAIANGKKNDQYGEQTSAGSNEVSAKTRAGEKPAMPTNVKLQEKDNGDFQISWDEADGATEYIVQRAGSLFGEYQDVKTVTETSTTVTPDAGNKYSNYYRIIAQRDNSATERSDASDSVSLETTLFGSHTIVLSPDDDVEKLDKLIADLCEQQNDINNDAQFNSGQWQIYFKPGNYTDTACMGIGFNTSFNGLGKMPTDVKLNNVEVPAYLTETKEGTDGQQHPNATCNFWRSMENVSIINTGNDKGKASHWSNNWRTGAFNWAVAQAAPLRRVASEREVAYDNNYGWASGGYVADCLFTGAAGAGTYSGQQFYTRNSEITGKAYGTQLNNFYQGVLAADLPTDENYESKFKGKFDKLESGQGYTNWGIADDKGNQQVITSITETPKISEKPFLFLDDNAYKVFVPAVRENTTGISWGSDKANGGLGEGETISLDQFYIAYPSDTAAEINKQIAAGKNIYFTPGIYRAEVPIQVNRENTILLGTGMSSIIPDNDDVAMEIGDVGGVRVAGLIFDAGVWSKYLMRVGKKGQHTDHADNPVVLQDLFFRVGGTTNKLTKSDYALEINSDDTIGDHFWIWRADHGAGVEWYGNESYHGLIVNGDDVTCYALFDEHFEKYDALWNGENGATYFFQNEKCYDPIAQSAWMSHKDTTNGYSAYKVANKVKKHYAVGLGIYNVLICTGPEYNSSKVSIQLDNAVEIPNREDVRAEDICIQTFASEDGALQKFNHIINGVGPGVSSGRNGGEGYSRKFLLSYHNGTAKYGTQPEPDKKGKFVGITTEENAKQPMNEVGDIDVTVLAELETVVRAAECYVQTYYTNETWEIFADARLAAWNKLKEGEDWAVQEDIEKVLEVLDAAQAQLVIKDGYDTAEIQKELIGKQKKILTDLIDEYQQAGLVRADYPADEWDAYKEAESDANAVAKKDNISFNEIKKALNDLKTARKTLDIAGVNLQRDLIQQEILKAAALEKEDYTTDSWNQCKDAIEKALADARAAFLKEDITVKELKTANQALVAAQKDLVRKEPVSDPAEEELKKALDTLKDEINKAVNAGLKASDYTEDSWKNYTNALDKAQETTAKDNATLDEIKKATQDLLTAQENLEKIDSASDPAEEELKKALDTLKDEISKAVNAGLKASDYTEGSWKNYSGALAAAQTVAAKDNVTLEEVKKATQDLLNARKNLAMVSGNPQNPGPGQNVGNNKVPAKKLTLNKKKVYIVKGKSLKLKAKMTPANTTDKVTWKSSKKKIATVSKGKIKAKKVGSCKITAKTTSGKKVTVKVYVVKKAKKSTSIKLNKKKATVKKGAWILLSPTLKPAKSTDTVKWKSSNKKVASVDAYGFVTGKKKGKTTITATTKSGKKVKCKITVK